MRLIIHTLLVMLLFISTIKARRKSGQVCITAECVTAAAQLINNIDIHADPCEDFYNYACGRYNSEAVIPEHKPKVGAFDTTRDAFYARLKKIFEDEDKADEPMVFQSARKLYSSCMDLDNIQETSKEDLLEIINKLGGWPVLPNTQFNSDDFSWQNLNAEINRMGFDAKSLVSIVIATDADNSSRRILKIDQAELGLEREYLVKGSQDKDVQAYFRYMVEAAKYLGTDEQTAKTQMKDVLDFELKLAELTIKKEERRNKTALNNKMPLADVKELFHVDWVNIINDMLENPINENQVNSKEIINVAVPKFVRELSILLEKTDNKIVANYMIWRVVKDTFPFLNEEAREITQNYKEILRGTKTEPPRWETCVKITAGLGDSNLYFKEGSLSNGVGSMYARNYFPLEDKKVVDSIETNIRAEFKTILDELNWMDEETRIKAHEKVDLITSFMGYAEEILDNDLINEYYEGFAMNDSSYLKNYLTLKRFVNKYYVNVFREEIDKKSWKTHGGAAVVNAFYNGEDNSMIFPAGFLAGVFFDAERPAYMNYGTIGLVIGHEITHGFDDRGSQTDGEGNLVDWWSSVSKEQYIQKTKCIKDQYTNFTVEIEGETFNLNGVNTQGENVADNGGIKQAIRAYRRLISKHGAEPTLPGLPYTQDQLFWLSSASIWCGVSRPAKLKNQVLVDPHSPSRFRVNGPFKNRPEFSQDWNCPKGSPMNPKVQCEVW